MKKQKTHSHEKRAIIDVINIPDMFHAPPTRAIM